MNKDFFKDLKKEVIELKFKHPHIADDSAFVVWFLRAFVTEDEKQAINSLTGKAGDKSSNAIFIDHDNRIIFIVQGKYHSNNNSNEPRSHILALSDLGRSIVSKRSDMFKTVLNRANPIVQMRLEESHKLIHKRDYKLVLQYVTTGKISTTCIEEAESRLDEFDNVRYETFSYTDLMKLMQDYIDGAAPPVPTISLQLQNTEVFSRSDKATGITSWIFSMRGNEIGNLFKDNNIRLFARNIRGYLGNTEINRVMKSTILKEPQYFWYYNNGITIVCDEAKQIKKGSSNIIKVKNAQIINGQQTTRTLYLAGKNDAEVLVKLIEIPRDSIFNKFQYGHLISEIVSATNWQNAISQSDLKSNDAEQVRIDKEFKKLNYFYIRKRMSKTEAVRYGANKYSFKINKEELARAVAACTVDPYEVRLGKNRLFEDDIYYKIFNGRKASEYINIYWLYRFVSYWSKGDDRKVYAKWHVLYFLWRLLEIDFNKYSKREQFRLMAERKNRYYKELQHLDRLINELFKLSLSFYLKYNKIDGKIQNAQNFFKHVNLDKKLLSYYNRSTYRRKINSYKKSLLYNIELLKDK